MSTPTAGRQPVSRPLLIVLGVAVLAALGYVLFAMSSSPDDELAAAAPSEPVVAESEPAAPPLDPKLPSEAGSEIAAVEPTFEVFQARDPFEQLVANDTGSGDATIGTTTPVSAVTPVDGSDPTVGAPPVVTDPAPTNAPGGGQSQTSVGGTTIMLEEIFSDGGEDTALVRVDDEGYEATEGETVAGDLTVLDIAGNCATMRFDDRRFILCEGEQIQK